MIDSWEEEWGKELYHLFHEIENEAGQMRRDRGKRYPSELFNELRAKILSERLNVNVKDRHGYTPISVAIDSSDLTMIHFLFGNRADPNIPVPSHLDWADPHDEGSVIFYTLGNVSMLRKFFKIEETQTPN